MKPLRFVEHLRDLVAGVDVVLSDIWGVVHNGLESFPEACEALHTFRSRGGTVILITNAPRPADSVQRQLRKLGVADDTYDAIVSSGDLTRHYITEHAGKSVFWIGPERDSSIYRGLDPVFAPLPQADYIVCTGPFDDEIETAEDYRGMMNEARKRNLTLVCANPDIVVERGDRLVICAGAIAELYREIGGEVIFYGKPHRPIYQRALSLAMERRGTATPLNRVLAIGDSVRTDLAGAQGFGIECLFVMRGIHAGEFEGIDGLDPAAVKELFGHPPLALTRELRW
jgi:HAD superfamily hydrolase (TIGR01459 family)